MANLLFGIDWGTAPDWIAAVGTVGALAVAIGLLSRELKASRERREAEGARQARLCSAWFTRTQLREHAGWPHPRLVEVQAKVENFSEEPIFDVQLWIAYHDGTEVQPSASRWFGTIAPHSSPREQAWHDIELDESRLHRYPSAVRAQITFTDAQGRRWRRAGATLERVKDTRESEDRAPVRSTSAPALRPDVE